MVSSVTPPRASSPGATSPQRLPDTAQNAPARPLELLACAPSRIRDHLYLGSFCEANNLATLQQLGIKQVINVTRHRPCLFADALSYRSVPVDDTPRETLAPYFCQVAAWIGATRASGGATLVHCEMGISRSATLVLATLMRDEMLTLGEAAKAVRQVRPRIAPNAGFCAELRALEVELFVAPRTLEQITAADREAPARMPRPADLASWVALWLQARQEGDGKVPAGVRDGVGRAVALLPPAPLQAALSQTIRAAWEAYGGATAAQALARGELGDLLDHLAKSGELTAACLQRALEQTSAEEAWQDLLLDVPLAADYLHALRTQLGLPTPPSHAGTGFPESP